MAAAIKRHIESFLSRSLYRYPGMFGSSILSRRVVSPSPLLCTNYLQSPRKYLSMCSVLKISAKVKFPDGNSHAERHYPSRSIFRSALFMCLFGICLVLPSKRRNADSFEKCLLFHSTTTEIWDSDISRPMFFIASTDSGIKAVLYSHF